MIQIVMRTKSDPISGLIFFSFTCLHNTQFILRYKPNQRELLPTIASRNRVAKRRDDRYAMRTLSSFADSLQGAA